MMSVAFELRSRAATSTLLLLGALSSSSGCTPANCPTGTEINGTCQSPADELAESADAGPPASGAAAGRGGPGSKDDSNSWGSAGRDATAGRGSGGRSSEKSGAFGDADMDIGNAGAGGAGGRDEGAAGGAAVSAGSAGDESPGDEAPSGPCSDGSFPETEACDDLDNDCDGQIDEALTMTCGEAMVGICILGESTCDRGAWTECEGQIDPREETCDAEMLDENCDGVGNENCPCSQGEMKSCGQTIGVCVEGTQICDAAGQWSKECTGEVKAARDTDLCDGQGLDEDCDGKADVDDENDCECVGRESEPCMAGMGVCAEGMRTCADGRWGKCTALTMAGTEKCDGRGLDEDCDGKADAADSSDCQCVGTEQQDCQTDEPGICKDGTRACRDGRWGACTSTRRATGEVCDGRGGDEDCDGRADKADSDCECVTGDSKNCGSDRGECSLGKESCSNGKWSGDCRGGRGASEEIDCNGLDEDCNGTPDDGCSAGLRCIEGKCGADLPTGSYSNSCDECSADGETLSCDLCETGTGGTQSSTVRYRSCATEIANCWGTLTCQANDVPGSWRNSCDLVSWDGCRLTADCQDGVTDVRVRTMWDYATNPCSNVTNCGGNLACDAC